ncbi:hypothetical protein B566_EDAN011175 [Ephemera danica]|nr:hypothetical protein B566_EDAN011175 [Ephemera danica]
MSSPFVLLLVLVTIAAASQTLQVAAENTNANDDCDFRFSQCEHELHDLRKQRERAKATAYQLGNQLWRLANVKQFLNQEIRILRHQIEHPDAPVPHVVLRGSGPGLISYPNVIDLVTSNCTANLLLCEISKTNERNIIQYFENKKKEHLSAIAEQLLIHDELRATASSLKSQLADRNVTPHPSSHNDFNLGNSAEFDLDSTEIERLVNASVDRRDTRTS